MAGQVQLLSSGPQEQFFTLDPDYSHFIDTFKQRANFSVDHVNIDPENVADFGKKVRCKIPQNQGDLLKTLSVSVTMPQLPGSLVYVESAGHALIEYVELIIGGKVIERLTSDYLQIYSEHNVTQTKQYALEQLIGKYPLRTSDRRVSEVEGNAGIVIHGTLGNTSNETFFVDLPFFFHNHPELAIPVCAITDQEIEVEFKLRDVQDMIVRIDGNYELLDQSVSLEAFQLCTEVVYVDSVERIKIQKSCKEYLITQVQQNVFELDAGVNEGQFRLDFINPVKELYFVIQRQGSNVNAGGYNSDFSFGSVTAADANYQGNFVTPFDYDNTSNVQDGKYILYENLNYLTLTLDNQDIITQETGGVTFLKAVQAAIHHSKTQLIRRFYSYSFALQPEEWFPTGQINFSLMKEQILKMNLTSCPDFSRQIRVYGVNYNILRVSEGTAKTIFTLKY